jgi:Delta3,5-Delta2,4-dienoyl-CoA isomerase
MSSSLPKLTTLSYTFPQPFIVHVELNRPKNLNAMNKTFFTELKLLFTALNEHPDLRVVVLTGSGKCFTAGLDLVEAPSIFQFEEVNKNS